MNSEDLTKLSFHRAKSQMVTKSQGFGKKDKIEVRDSLKLMRKHTARGAL